MIVEKSCIVHIRCSHVYFVAVGQEKRRWCVEVGVGTTVTTPEEWKWVWLCPYLRENYTDVCLFLQVGVG